MGLLRSPTRGKPAHHKKTAHHRKPHNHKKTVHHRKPHNHKKTVHYRNPHNHKKTVHHRIPNDHKKTVHHRNLFMTESLITTQRPDSTTGLHRCQSPNPVESLPDPLNMAASR